MYYSQNYYHSPLPVKRNFKILICLLNLYRLILYSYKLFYIITVVIADMSFKLNTMAFDDIRLPHNAKQSQVFFW